MIEHVPISATSHAAIAEINTLLKARGDGFTTSIADRRAAMLAFAQAAPPVAGVAFDETELGGVRVVRVTPPASLGDVLFLHGGAYVLGSADTHKGLAARYALASRCRFHVLDYALAPERPFPAGLEDAVAAWIELAASAPTAMLAGDSAGGGLALATAVALRDRHRSLPAAMALTSPWVDLTLTGPSLDGNGERDAMLSRRGLAQDADRYRGPCPAADPLVSPLFADLGRLPTTFIQVGEAEVLRDDAVRLEAALAASGVTCRLERWEGMTHAWSAFGAALPEAGRSIERFGAWLRARADETAS